MKKWIALMLALVLSLGLLGCESAPAIEDPEACKRALNGQSAVTLSLNYEATQQATNLVIDDTVAGRLQESGLLNTKWTVSVQKTDWFYMKFVTDSLVNQDEEGIVKATTYGFFDSNDNPIGYMQLRAYPAQGVHYCQVFLDETGTPTGFYAPEDGSVLYDIDNAQAAHGEFTLGFLSDSTITVTPDGVDIPFWIKLGMYQAIYQDNEPN